MIYINPFRGQGKLFLKHNKLIFMILQEILDDFLLLEQELNAKMAGLIDPIQRSKTAQIIISKALKKIRSAILEKKFRYIKDEIIFFKEILPKFLSLSYYFKTLHDMETHKPVCSDKDLIIYWEKQLDDLKCFFKNHEEFYIYVRSENSDSDHVYFVRDEFDRLESHCSFDNTIDNRVSTKYSNLTAKIMANDKICEYIKLELSILNNTHQVKIQEKKASSENIKITWTNSKIALIELLHALYEDKAFNNGDVTITQVIAFFECNFNISLGHHSGTFSELIQRNCPTKYLENLIQKLKNKINSTLEKLL